MELLTIISLLAVMEFLYFGFRVGGLRAKYGVTAPATTGNEIWERYYRVQCNTMELLVAFLPCLWAFGYYIGEYWAAAIGSVFLVGRVIYYVTYVKDPATRSIGAALSLLPCYILASGALIGTVVHYFS